VVVEGLQKTRPGAPLEVTAVELGDFDRPTTPADPDQPAAG
jgi:hypothetical protein